MAADLTRLVNPQSIAFIGASDRANSLPQRALENLIEHSDFRGELYLVNPKRQEVYGRRCYPSIADVPAAPDVAIVTTPAETVLPTLEDCATKGVRFAIVFTAGFGEVSEEGRVIERKMKALAAKSGMRIYGPNCPGLNNINARIGLAFSPAWRTDNRPGPVGLVTQGGALGRTFMQSMARGLGIGLWCSAGNEVDLEISDFIHYMADAPDIEVIATILEGVRDGVRFADAVLHARRNGKPVVALKIGKSDLGMAAAASHTAAIASSAEVNSAVFRQLGVIEVDDLDELGDVASLFARARSDPDAKIGIFSLSGGSAALSADMVGLNDLELAKFAPETFDALRKVLPPYASFANPLDTSGNILATPEVLHPALTAVATDPSVGVTLMPIPLDYGRFMELVCEALIKVQRETGAMIVPVWMSDRIGGGHALLVEAGLVPIRTLSKAAVAIRRWRDHARRLRDFDPAWRPVAKPETKPERTHTLTEVEAKQRLAEAGVSAPAGRLCARREDVSAAMAALGARVVAKVVSRDITHKSDIGGVRVGLNDAASASQAWTEIMEAARKHRPDAALDGVLIEAMAPAGGVEAFVGVHTDPVFGPIMTFGLGGVYVELFRDVSRRMLPVTPRESAAMIRETRCYELLKGQRGRGPSDVEALERLLVAVSDFVCKTPGAVSELEINPIWVGPKGAGAMALDAVLTLNE